MRSAVLNPGRSLRTSSPAKPSITAEPDGTTLAILTPARTLSTSRTVGRYDHPASIFFYNVMAPTGRSCADASHKQVNSRQARLLTRATRSTPPAARDAVCEERRNVRGCRAIPLNHFAPGATGNARNKGVGLGVQPNASGMDISADGQTLVVANNYNDSISVIDTATRTVRYEHDLRPFFANNEGRNGGVGGTFPYAVALKGNGTAQIWPDVWPLILFLFVASGVALARFRRTLD
jgi:hypothetical protein